VRAQKALDAAGAGAERDANQAGGRDRSSRGVGLSVAQIAELAVCRETGLVT